MLLFVEGACRSSREGTVLGEVQFSEMLEDVVEDEGVEGEVCDAIGESSCPLKDLARDLDEGVEELFELHLDDLLLKLRVLNEQSIPDSEGPGQGCDDLVDPVGV